MVSTPMDSYINWSRKAYPDDKSRVFPISAERLCLYVKYTSFPVDNATSLISYLSTHPKHGNEWCLKIKDHPAILELLNTKKQNGSKPAIKNQHMRPKCVVVEKENSKGYMMVSNNKEDIMANKVSQASKEPHKVTFAPVSIAKDMPFPPIVNHKRKKLLKGLAEKDKAEGERKRFKEELQIKDEEITKLRALLSQYKALLIDKPEQECVIIID
ncbi:hypothetical protein BY458DRAFT_559418 [Sporodiniella umbellata]|nr:hypothetical protein BY458DRAFT_559418 [Sporodiniella umbellata]